MTRVYPTYFSLQSIKHPEGVLDILAHPRGVKVALTKGIYFKILLIFISLFLIWPISNTYAQENTHKVVYDVHYAPLANGDSNVELQAAITNLRSDVYVKEFSLSFPSSFAISQLSARDDRGEITTRIQQDDRFFKITLSFSDPAIGKNQINNFYLRFVQKNLFKTEGTIWEVILPTIGTKENTTYNITISLPEATEKKLSVAKPKPTHISQNTIYWQDVKTRTVYAVFGSSQLYELKLTYNLKSDELRRVYYDVALPPETLYQKVFLNSLEPAPEKVYRDEDDNLLARYILNIKEQKQVIYKGAVEVFSQPQEDLRDYFSRRFEKQKKYLLSAQPYWNLEDSSKLIELENLKSLTDIYRYVTGQLTYNYQRVGKNLKRLGADGILDDPTQAVCMEFTDLFIALARRQGIYSREINGYGFSHDQNLRPLSLISDVLHSWPEYYDEKNVLWIPFDPTWENTSGIDYFNSFDLNHIVFAIHGKSSSEPVSAGMYKISDDSHDVSIRAVSIAPQAVTKVSANASITRQMVDKRSYKGMLKIKNTGSVSLKNGILTINNKFLTVKPRQFKIDLLAPYETAAYSFQYTAPQITQQRQETLTLSLNGQTLRSETVTITSFEADLLYKGLGVAGGLLIFMVIYILWHRFAGRTQR